MKFLSDFKNTSLEEAKTDYKKFDTLVRSGLGNASQLQKIHHVLNKLKEDNPVLTAAEKNIVQELLNKMVDVQFVCTQMVLKLLCIIVKN